MKLFYGVAASALAISFCARVCSDGAPLDLPTRGPHHRVEPTATGGYVVTMANGLHYADRGESKESDPTIEIQPGGAAALRLAHPIAFGQTLAAGVDILTPDGLHLRAAPRAIAYFDALDGRTALLATLKDPPDHPAEIHPGNVLVYPDAFDGVRASVRYVVDRGSIIQCVVLADNPPDPTLFGMNADTVRIEVWTAFTEAPMPQQSDTLLRVETDPVLRAAMAEPDVIDTTLAFGEMQMVPGKAFLLSSANGNPAPGKAIDGAVPVAKRWIETGQESWLIESVDYAAAREQLAALPPSSLIVDADTASQLVADDRALEPVEPAQPVNLPMRTVSEPEGQDGFCIDYTLVYGAQSWTFQSGVTYLVDGSVWITSSATFQTNAILKYRRNATLTVSGSIITPSTGPPAILTSFDDFTAGELLPGGTPVGYYANTALYLQSISGPYGQSIKNLDIRHAKLGISASTQYYSHTVSNCRFHVCQTAVHANSYASVVLTNVVACAVPTLYTYYQYGSVSASNITNDCQRTVDTGGNNDSGQRNVPPNLTNVIAVAGGEGHSLALLANGTVVAWGLNDHGQTNVPAGLTNVIGITAGHNHGLALRANGTVVAWGNNEYGQTNVPSGLTNVINIKAGNRHSLALKSDGKVVAWGWDAFGPAAVPLDVSNVVAISASWYTSMALRTNGVPRVWGGNTTVHHNVPVSMTNAVGIAAGYCHAFGLRADGSLIPWGCNEAGQTDVPPHATNVMAMASAPHTMAALKRDGTVVPWGLGLFGKTNLPAGLSNVVALDGTVSHFLFIRSGAPPPTISAQPVGDSRFVGGSFTFAVTAYSPTPGTYQWQFNGTNIAGATNASLTLSNLQVGDAGNYTVIISNSAGSITSAPAVLTVIAEPIILSQPSDMRVLAGSNFFFSLTLTNAGGATNYWQVNGTTVAISSSTNYYVTASAATRGTWTVICSNQIGATVSDPWTLEVILPGQVVGWGDAAWNQTNAPYPLSNVVAVAAGEHHNLLLKDDGTVLGCGAAFCGETNVPSALNDVVAVGAGWLHSLALKANGTVIAWGDGSYGQTNVPSGLSGVKAIAAGYYHNLALKTNGTVVAWGHNAQNQTNVPATLTNVVAIAAGYQHSLALRGDGTVCGWGLDNEGQCVVPGTLSNVVAVAAGTWHSLALKADGTVVGWGSSSFGESTSPSGLSNVLAIAAGGEFSIALKNDGTFLVWGNPLFGITNVPAPLGDVYAISAGFNHALALTYSPVLNYNYKPAQDLLVIYNSNSVGSVAVKDYYLANRPKISDANVLGIGCTTGEYMSRTNFTNQLWAPVLGWLNANPTKRPNFVVLCYDIPSRWPNSFLEPAAFAAEPNYPELVGSIAYEVRSRFPDRKPFVTSLNMQTTNDCIGYINKLAAFGSNSPLNQVVIRASPSGYSNHSFVLDNVRFEGFTNHYWGFLPRDARDALVGLGVPTNSILYADNWDEVHYSDPWPSSFFHPRNATNVAGYINWGQHGGWNDYWPTNIFAPDGQPYIKFNGDSSWYIIQTIESWNGLWPAGSTAIANQSSFQMWFFSNSFGGTNYAKTPVGAVSHTNEPNLPGVNETQIYFGLWHLGKNAAIAAWVSNLPGKKVMQATGDPWVAR